MAPSVLIADELLSLPSVTSPFIKSHMIPLSISVIMVTSLRKIHL
jgi:hypothetical protein